MSHRDAVTRRGFLVSAGTVISVIRAYPANPSCSLTPEQEEGPYYVDAAQIRQVISEDKRGVPLRLGLRIVNAKTCAPLPNAACDIWHCDAEGVYSGFTAMGSGRGGGGRGGPPPGGFDGPPSGQFNSPPEGFRPPPGPPPGPPRGPRNIDSKRFLRGIQLTDASGSVEFQTLYPGWYEGRAIHIHIKVRVAGAAQDTYQGGHVCHTGQIFLPEDVTERIAKLPPYLSNSGTPRMAQARDHVFQGQHGAGQISALDRLVKNGEDSDGFLASITLAVDPDATPQLVTMPAAILRP